MDDQAPADNPGLMPGRDLSKFITVSYSDDSYPMSACLPPGWKGAECTEGTCPGPPTTMGIRREALMTGHSSSSATRTAQETTGRAGTLTCGYPSFTMIF